MSEITLVSTSKKPVLAVAYSEAGVQSGSELTLDSALLELYGAATKTGTVAKLPLADQLVAVIGVGKRLKLRDFGAEVARLGLSCAVSVPLSDEADLHALVEGLLLGGKTPTKFKKAEQKQIDFEVVVPAALQNADLQATIDVCKQIVAIRELINQPANELYPQKLAEHAKALAAGLPIEVEIWDETKLAQERCGGILGVGIGSVRPPRLVKLSYRGGGKHIALVGKGITFDTGGLSLKPPESMVGMKYDMAGSATILGAILGIARHGLKIDVDAYMCLAENMPSGSATRPGDVITIRNGTTVEVLNTDAEGRLVLADGLSLAVESGAEHIIDVATLTGAATIALGNRYAGVMGQGDAVELCLKASEHADELLWHMPLPEELRPLLDSELADIANVKIGNRAGGMLIGGHFLAEFVPAERSWAHLDIAGPANNDAAPYSVVPKGASGVMIRSLIALARGLSQ
jgi:leucyl aminopeptidase